MEAPKSKVRMRMGRFIKYAHCRKNLKQQLKKPLTIDHIVVKKIDAFLNQALSRKEIL